MDMTLRSVASATSGEEAERVRLLAGGDARSSLAFARDQIRFRESVQRCAAKLSNSGSSHAREFESHEVQRKINGGQGEIRTHVPELPDHPISSRRRYDRFGTCP